MEEQEFWDNNPHMTPQLQRLYKDRWKRILNLNSRIKTLINEIDEMNKKRLNALSLQQYDDVDDISMKQHELTKKAAILIMTYKVLFIQVGASNQYNFELN
ncbi:MAG: hypothetical protein BWY47_01920 [Bacteroidetes bacterium ADurb.Bin302]|nr:MAG: hypothetical protein BWY47_01920 [Bacteroidetes bacterium ADurb.Bin302]